MFFLCVCVLVVSLCDGLPDQNLMTAKSLNRPRHKPGVSYVKSHLIIAAKRSEISEY